MGFERYENRHHGNKSRIGEGEIKLMKSGYLMINTVDIDKIKEIAGFRYYELFFDKKKRKVGINFMEKPGAYTYKVSMISNMRGIGQLQCRAFLKEYNIVTEFNRIIKYNLVGTMLVIDVDFE